MKYTKQSFSAVIVGDVYGYLWSGSSGSRQFNRVLTDEKMTIKKIVKEEMSKDFESCYLSPDSVVIVTLIKPNRRIVRCFDVSFFGSISQFVGDSE